MTLRAFCPPSCTPGGYSHFGVYSRAPRLTGLFPTLNLSSSTHHDQQIVPQGFPCSLLFSCCLLGEMPSVVGQILESQQEHVFLFSPPTLRPSAACLTRGYERLEIFSRNVITRTHVQTSNLQLSAQKEFGKLGLSMRTQFPDHGEVWLQ